MNALEVKRKLKVKVLDKEQWVGEIIGFAPKSRTLVEIKRIDRGPGWDQEQRRYVGVKPTKNSWYRGEDYGFGLTELRRLELLELLK